MSCTELLVLGKLNSVASLLKIIAKGEPLFLSCVGHLLIRLFGLVSGVYSGSMRQAVKALPSLGNALQRLVDESLMKTLAKTGFQIYKVHGY